MNNKTKSTIFWLGMAFFFLPGLVHAYLLMPFPGSQDLEAIKLCYYLEKIILPLRILGAVLIAVYFIKYPKGVTTKSKVVKIAVMVIGLVSFYFTDYEYKAATMFKEPGTIKFANAIHSKVPESYLIIGVVNNGVAKAYPVIYLGYHHKVQDSVGALPVLVTYCTMCRTGRVFSPIINGKKQVFRLVGARHYNAVIEDEDTKTWWYQATGEAAVGPMRGSSFKEIPYEQSTLAAWLNKHPGSLILQPDNGFRADYADLKNYDRVQAVDKDSTLVNKNSLVRKSWVLGVVINKQPKAYNWRKLQRLRVLNDSIGNIPLMLAIEKDSLTFHAWKRSIDGKVLNFKIAPDGQLTDNETASVWNGDGTCISGTLKGTQLIKQQAYQEYRHSWLHFHPGTLLWNE
ncbi:MAG: DUF3179 domain-containing protein [Mucilaginibacter sp.]|nr:DUF3179 domain-containing protein [Mucilaginibacter sp.]